MMTDAQKRMMEKLGLTRQDFEPTEITESERLEQIEAALIELAAMMTGGDA